MHDWSSQVKKLLEEKRKVRYETPRKSLLLFSLCFSHFFFSPILAFLEVFLSAYFEALCPHIKPSAIVNTGFPPSLLSRFSTWNILKVDLLSYAKSSKTHNSPLATSLLAVHRSFMFCRFCLWFIFLCIFFFCFFVFCFGVCLSSLWIWFK